MALQTWPQLLVSQAAEQNTGDLVIFVCSSDSDHPVRTKKEGELFVFKSV